MSYCLPHTHTQINQSGQFSIVQDGYAADVRPEASIRCGCHVVVKDKTSRTANVKLIIASIIALFFMVGEVLGKQFLFDSLWGSYHTPAHASSI